VVAAVTGLLDRLKGALIKKDAEAYAACFSSEALEKEFGPQNGQTEKIKLFLAKLATSKCAFDNIRIVAIPDKPQEYHVQCYRQATLMPRRMPDKPDDEAVIETKREFYEDSLVIDVQSSSKSVIKSMDSKVSLECRKAAYTKLLEEDDKRLAQLRADDKGKRAWVLARKAQHLMEGLEDKEKAENCLREAVGLTGKGSMPSLALAGLLMKTGRPEEALEHLRSASQEMQDDDLHRAEIKRWIEECEKAVREKAESLQRATRLGE
jgi:tetratricopeptide (TPR) repeat protein